MRSLRYILTYRFALETRKCVDDTTAESERWLVRLQASVEKAESLIVMKKSGHPRTQRYTFPENLSCAG